MPPRFAADAMLGRLARWLRVLGFDTAYDSAIADPELVRMAAIEERVLLTRDRTSCASCARIARWSCGATIRWSSCGRW